MHYFLHNDTYTNEISNLHTTIDIKTEDIEFSPEQDQYIYENIDINEFQEKKNKFVDKNSENEDENNTDGTQISSDGTQVAIKQEIKEQIDKETQLPMLKLKHKETKINPLSSGKLQIRPNPNRKNNKYGAFEGKNNSRTHYCLYCNYKNWKRNWLDHLQTKHKDKKLIFCRFVACKMPFETKEEYDKHLLEEHPKQECKVCGKVYKFQSQLKIHMIVHLPSEIKMTLHEYMCTYCGAKFTSRTGYRAHEMNVHTKAFKHKCYEEGCDMAYFEREQLMIHIRKKHTGELPFVCTCCEKSFASKTALNKHEKARHTEVKIEHEPCPICQKMMKKHYLPEHIKVVHQGNSESVCTICNKTFPTVSGRSRHEKIHLNIKPHACQHCGKAFVQKSNLRQHERIHTGEKPCLCKHCGKGFVQHTRRNQHQLACKMRRE